MTDAGISKPKECDVTKTDYLRQYPDFPWLSADDPAAVERLLGSHGWLAADEQVQTCAPVGGGNMNLTLRVRTHRRSLIVKQARPWVEKFDHIAAPWDRIVYELRFYERVSELPEVGGLMPRLLAASSDARVLLLEDLGDARDMTDLYGGGPLETADVSALARYLRSLHDATRGQPDPRFANREMRALNHEHIYRFPLDRKNGLDLDRFEPGLTAAARQLQDDAKYVAAVSRAGRVYLADGHCLVHGDYFPGSWLRTPNGLRVIDPEFCFYGPPEFDLGCAVAHLVLAGRPTLTRPLLMAYDRGGGPSVFDERLVAVFAGVEIMRRLIGVAQLPMDPANGQRRTWLEQSRPLVVEQTLSLGVL